jgi:hypothetical protein
MEVEYDYDYVQTQKEIVELEAKFKALKEVDLDQAKIVLDKLVNMRITRKFVYNLLVSMFLDAKKDLFEKTWNELESNLREIYQLENTATDNVEKNELLLQIYIKKFERKNELIEIMNTEFVV